MNRSRFLAGLALAAFLLLPAQALAGSTRFEILASAAQVATANGSAISTSGIKEMVVYATCTASSAPTRLDVYLQSSSDGGTTWYDIPAEFVLLTTATGTDVTSTSTMKRNILDNVTTCASAVKAVAVYRVFGDQVRAAWVISGTSFTISVKAVGKS
jgi:hypothetical protein